MPLIGTGRTPKANTRPAAAIFAVSIYFPPRDGELGKYQDMPNIIYVGRGEREGAAPHVARYRYDLRADLPPEFPKRVEDFFRYASAGPYVVRPDDRLVCRRLLPNGTWQVEADGYAQIPTAEMSAESEGGRIEAVSVPIRCLDYPLPGAVYRDGNDLTVGPTAPPAVPDETAAVFDVRTDLPIRFNPDGVPNATPKGVDSKLPPIRGNPEALDRYYPVFLDPLLARRPSSAAPPAPGAPPPAPPPVDPTLPPTEGNGAPATPVDGYRRAWNLDMAVRYLVAVGNPDEKYVRNPPFESFAALLTSVEPNDDGGPIDLRDYTTYKLAPILVPDTGDLAGRSWPEAIEDIVRPHGFSFAWVLGTADKYLPGHTWMIKRVDDTYPVKTPSHGRYGDRIDDGYTTIHAAELERSYPTANAVRVLSSPKQYEVGIVLAPMFAMQVSDINNRAKYKKSQIDQVDYRRWGAGEAGDPYYLNTTLKALTAPLDLSSVFGKGERKYSRRPRPAFNRLFTVDILGVPLEAQLYISTDYGTPPPAPAPGPGGGAVNQLVAGGNGANPYPAVYVKGRGTKRIVTKNWSLLKKSFGIEVTADEPWAWDIGRPPAGSPAGTPFPGGIVDVLKAMTNPDKVADRPSSNALEFWLILVATIEHDRDLGTFAPRRAASPAKYQLVRYADSRDRYLSRTIDGSSPLGNGVDFPARDDSDAARAHADARRRLEELGDFNGVLTVEGYIRGVNLLDRVDGIARRGIGLNGLAAAEQGESPIYPTVLGIDWTNDPEQRTTFRLGSTRPEGGARADLQYTASKKARNLQNVDMTNAAALGLGPGLF